MYLSNDCHHFGFFYMPAAVLKLFSKSMGQPKPNMAEMVLGLIIMFLVGNGKAMKYSEANFFILLSEMQNKTSYREHTIGEHIALEIFCNW